MGYKVKEDHVRVRTTFGFKWIWELVTRDGHILAVSQPFSNRDECEASAHTQQLRVIGGRKLPKPKIAERQGPGRHIKNNDGGLWVWEDVSDDGQVVAGSPVCFLTREECERHAAQPPSSVEIDAPIAGHVAQVWNKPVVNRTST